MKKILIVLFLIAAPITTILAQDKIAYINYQEIILKMPETKDMQAKLTAKSEAIQKTAASIEAEYQALIEKFQKDSTEITESIVADRRKQVEDLEARYKTFMETSQADMQKEQEMLLTPIQEKLRKAVKEVGDQNNFLFILDGSSLLYKNTTATDANKLVESKLGIQ